METKEFTRKDGSIGKEYKLSEGDIFTANFDKPYKSTNGEYENYSLGVTINNKELTIKLTQTQYTKLLALGNIKGKTFTTYTYESKKPSLKKKTFIGIKAV